MENLFLAAVNMVNSSGVVIIRTAHSHLALIQKQVKCGCRKKDNMRGCVDANDQPRLECVWNHCLYVDSDGIHIDQYKPTNID